VAGRRSSRRREDEGGQGLVEFALAISVFMVVLMGTVDLGRAAYQYNGVAEAARELARVTSVHPGTTLGSSAETSSSLATQRNLVPGLGSPAFTCVDVAGSAVTGTCSPGSWVRVTVASTFLPVTPVASLLGTIVLTGSASAKIE
jgi:Flp pilus assembly protein TadG